MSCFNIYTNELEEIFFNSYKNNYTGYNDNIMPAKYGLGSYSLFTTEHLHFSHSLFALKQDINIESTNQESLFFITIINDGNFHLKNKNHDIDLLNNGVYLGFNSEGASYSSMLLRNEKNEKIQTFSFYFFREQLLDYLIELDATELIHKVKVMGKMEIIKDIHLSIKSNYIIQKLMQNPYNGHLKNIYFESVVYELLISLLTDLCPQKPKEMFLSDGDKDILHKAKNILLSDLQNPPTIEELSKMVPMNQSKLKSGFKVLFDNTIRNVLIEQRLEQAFKNLKKSDMSIWEIAHESGYENVSYFITIFRKKYGKTPGQIRKERRFYW